MNVQPAETFGLDRLKTPIGTALLVSDGDGVLRALDWEDHEQRMKELLRLQMGGCGVEDHPGAGRNEGCADGLFQG